MKRRIDFVSFDISEFDKVMEGTPLYVTTLRDPPDHLRSMFSYFDLAHKLGITFNNILSFIISNILGHAGSMIND